MIKKYGLKLNLFNKRAYTFITKSISAQIVEYIIN